MQVYIVVEEEGEYSDYTMTNLRVFASKADAEDYVAQLLTYREAGSRLCHAQVGHITPFAARVDWEAWDAEQQSAMLSDPDCVAAFEAFSKACAVVGRTAPKKINHGCSDLDCRWTIQEHELQGGGSND